jgi:3-(3-hydroxy-phenyl)propionate hydroxylase
MHDVVIVGGGPTGLMLAGELALAGVDAVILERRSAPGFDGSRARGFHSRTIEILDQRGIADRFLSQGRTVQALNFGGTPLQLDGFPSRHPYTLGLGQSQIEQILLDWVTELGVAVRRGVDVTDFVQDGGGVDVRLVDEKSLRTGFLVGADGGRSVVRKAAGIDFVGAEATRSYLIAEVQAKEETPSGMRLDDLGIHAMSVLGDGRTVGMVVTEQQLQTATEPSLQDLRQALTAVYGTDFGVSDPTWISRFTDATRQAVAYRKERVLLAGDAAHTHPPTGGQGIGLGVQDAVNLGWKLGQVVRGISPDSLLDSYHAERQPAAARVLKNVIVQALLQRGDPRTVAMSETISDLLTFEGPRTHLAGLLSGLDVRYDLGEGHSLLGRRVPDLDVMTVDGPRRVFELLSAARPVLLDLGKPSGIDITPWADRVQHVHAQYTGPWELPVVGAVPAPLAVLIRPDGHVAWVGDGTDGMRKALTTWFGAPTKNAPTKK